MANPKHLAELKKGVDHWNAWVKEQGPDFRTDPSEADLFGADLFGADLRAADLRAADLRGADLREADLIGADFSNANLRGADLFKAKLRWADLRKADLFGAVLRAADLREAVLRAAVLREADLRRADLIGADLREADLRAAVLRAADLREADLIGADLIEADLRAADVRTTVYSAVSTNDGGTAEYTNLTTNIGLDQSQLDSMIGDSGTILPDHLTRPAHWKTLEGRLNGKRIGPEEQVQSDTPSKPVEPTLPKVPTGNLVELKKSTLVLGADSPVPERADLESIYEDLREAAQDLRDLGNLSNQSPMLAKGIERFLKRIPSEFVEIEQVRFGAGLQALRLQFDRETDALNDIAPDKVGHIEAVLMYSDLIAARLPEWKTFLDEEEDDKAVFEARQEDVEAILEHAAEALESDPEHFDPSLFERIREYLDDATLVGYLAAKNVLLNIAHKTFTLSRDLIKDTVTETRKLAIKAIAGALLVQLGTVLGNMAKVLPKELFWLSDWLEYLPKLLA